MSSIVCKLEDTKPSTQSCEDYISSIFPPITTATKSNPPFGNQTTPFLYSLRQCVQSSNDNSYSNYTAIVNGISTYGASIIKYVSQGNEATKEQKQFFENMRTMCLNSCDFDTELTGICQTFLKSQCSILYSNPKIQTSVNSIFDMKKNCGCFIPIDSKFKNLSNEQSLNLQVCNVGCINQTSSIIQQYTSIENSTSNDMKLQIKSTTNQSNISMIFGEYVMYNIDGFNTDKFVIQPGQLNSSSTQLNGRFGFILETGDPVSVINITNYNSPTNLYMTMYDYTYDGNTGSGSIFFDSFLNKNLKQMFFVYGEGIVFPGGADFPDDTGFLCLMLQFSNNFVTLDLGENETKRGIVVQLDSIYSLEKVSNTEQCAMKDNPDYDEYHECSFFYKFTPIYSQNDIIDMNTISSKIFNSITIELNIIMPEIQIDIDNLKQELAVGIDYSPQSNTLVYNRLVYNGETIFDLTSIFINVISDQTLIGIGQIGFSINTPTANSEQAQFVNFFPIGVGSMPSFYIQNSVTDINTDDLYLITGTKGAKGPEISGFVKFLAVCSAYTVSNTPGVGSGTVSNAKTIGLVYLPIFLDEYNEQQGYNLRKQDFVDGSIFAGNPFTISIVNTSTFPKLIQCTETICAINNITIDSIDSTTTVTIDNVCKGSCNRQSGPGQCQCYINNFRGNNQSIKNILTSDSVNNFCTGNTSYIIPPGSSTAEPLDDYVNIKSSSSKTKTETKREIVGGSVIAVVLVLLVLGVLFLVLVKKNKHGSNKSSGIF
jgi:hypothetical protein